MKNFQIILLFLIVVSLNVFGKLPKNSSSPDFNLREVNTGKNYKLSNFKDKIVVLEWHSTSCAFTKRHTEQKTMLNLVKKYPDVIWLGIDSSGVDFVANAYSYYQWKQKFGINYPILSDIDGKIGKRYGARVTPHLVVINKGKVVYQGAVDDDVFGEKMISQRKNYIDQVLASLTTNGKLPKNIKPYNEAVGCGIKYQN